MSQADKVYAIALLRKLTMNEVFDVALECNELMAVGTPREYSEAHAIPLRTIQHRIKRGKLKRIEGGLPINIY